MIQLQRASAGSGKTFTLAKKFIGYLITAPVDPDLPEGKRRLCLDDAEIASQLRAILAITFTNKATAEMKQRIVEKLAALSNPSFPEDDSKVDYLNDFKRELGRTRSDIAKTCRHALRILLNKFGDFNVSTIDSFFQSVMRTFTYETNIADTYQVEMDTTLLASVGVEMAMQQINEKGEDEVPVAYWIRRLMARGQKKEKVWNVFAKSGRSDSLYSNFIRSTQRMENEAYKLCKEDLDKYFSALEKTGSRFRDVYENLERLNELELREAHSTLLKAIKNLEKDLQRLNASDSWLERYLKNRMEKLKHTEYDQLPDKKSLPPLPESALKNIGTGKNAFRVSIECPDGKKRKFNTVVPEDAISILSEDADAMYEAWGDWDAIKKSGRYATWLAYKETLLYLGLLHEIKNNIRDFLTENNLVELSETGLILRRIISDSEVPFIYERLGTRLRHYLIDEFQDTSRLQWENITPLLHESISTGEESLVIGDAKQSIYRFRNADSSIITRRLPEEFHDECRACGDSVDENTNWRSERHIVEFNNFFFRALAGNIDTGVEGVEGFNGVYAGVVQRPSHTDDAGYVAINFMTTEKPEEDRNDHTSIPAYFSHFGEMVDSLLRRGFRQRDIAFLVNTNAEGNAIIDTLVAYNSRLQPGDRKIDFVSDESLYVSRSRAVNTVLSALRALCEPRAEVFEKEEERNVKGLGKWKNMDSHFILFAMSREEEPTSRLLEEFREEKDPGRALREMIADMQALTLPALVEGTIHKFVSKRRRVEEAPYLAAFQDLVLEYCERYSSDVASFLRWWEKTGNKATVTSPEEIDAVKVMTIHKSKGLQFKCVIVPQAAFNFKPPTGASRKTEWMWVEPDMQVATAIDGTVIPMPPKVPVATTDIASLSASLGVMPHASEYRDFVKSNALDILNKAYVAFTRAEEELHIFVGMSKKACKGECEFLDRLNADFTGGMADGEPTATIAPEKFGGTGQALFRICNNPGAYIPGCNDPAFPYLLQEPLLRTNKFNNGDQHAGASAPEAGCGDGADNAEDDAPWFTVEYGHPLPLEEHLIKTAEKMAEKEKTGEETQMCEESEQCHIGEYRVTSFPSHIHYRDPDALLEDDEDDRDPRSEGRILHNILEKVMTINDLRRALKLQRVKGRIDRETEKRLTESLMAEMSEAPVCEWFRPGLRVLNERSVTALIETSGGERYANVRRPDRIIIDGDGVCTVIDYKFGELEKKEHIRQVSEYIELLRKVMQEGTPLFSRVKGYVWYVKKQKWIAVG